MSIYQTQMKRFLNSPAKKQSILLISPPHPISQIRHIKYTHPENCTPQQRIYQLEDERVQEWHHQFWLKNNTLYTNEKQAFREALLKKSDKEPCDADYSSFYSQYLTNTYEPHLAYNKQCWRNNFK